MSKFQKMLKTVATAEKEMKVEKSVKTEAPKKEVNVVKSFAGNKEVEKVQDMMFILKSMKAQLGKDLTEKELNMFAGAIQEKTATTVADVTDLIPSGFSGTFIQDAYAMTIFDGVFPFEQISHFGMTDTIGEFGMTAYIVDELTTPADSNDSMDDFEYRGGKLMAKTHISYEALADANIDMLANKRAGLVRAMSVTLGSIVPEPTAN